MKPKPDDGSPGAKKTSATVPRSAGGAATYISSAAMVFGLLGLLMHPLFIADPSARYAILVADGIALALAGWILLRVLRGSASLDFMVILAILYAGASIYLYISFVSDLVPAPGGT